MKIPSKISLKSGSSFVYSGGDRHHLEQISVHPLFKSDSNDYDLAVLRVKKVSNVRFYMKNQHNFRSGLNLALVLLLVQS